METITIRETISILFSMLVNPITPLLFGLVLTLSGFIVSRSFRRSSRTSIVDDELGFYSCLGGFILGTVGAIFGLSIAFIVYGTDVFVEYCNICTNQFAALVAYQLFIWVFSLIGIVIGGILGCRYRLKIKDKYFRQRIQLFFILFFVLCILAFVKLLS